MGKERRDGQARENVRRYQDLLLLEKSKLKVYKIDCHLCEKGKEKGVSIQFFLYIHKISLEGYKKSNSIGCLQEWEWVGWNENREGRKISYCIHFYII